MIVVAAIDRFVPLVRMSVAQLTGAVPFGDPPAAREDDRRDPPYASPPTTKPLHGERPPPLGRPRGG
jgi:hypothetical protein